MGGAAASAKTLLEKNGYDVRATGNAVHQDYEQTTVYYQSGRQKEAQAVADALSSKYRPVIQQSTLANPDMVLVVIGAK